MRDKYFIATGTTDEKRLEIINKIYNPITFSFLIESGLKLGMQVLEIGCGFGHTAIWLAQTIGPSGIVYAIDLNLDTLNIARENAQKAQIHNIEFIHLNLNDLKSLNKKFDFCYGRWVIEFCDSQFETVNLIYDLLNDGGIFTYETSNLVENENSSFLRNPIINAWHNLGIYNAAKSGAELNMANKMYDYMKKIGFKEISARRHQPVLITKEQKSIYSLGLLSARDSILKNQIINEGEFNSLLNECYHIEMNDEIITGCFNNLLIKGFKA